MALKVKSKSLLTSVIDLQNLQLRQIYEGVHGSHKASVVYLCLLTGLHLILCNFYCLHVNRLHR